jgi:hypothetical protein
MSTSWTGTVFQFLGLLPVLAVWIVGVVVLLIGWGRSPAARILALVALGIQILAGPAFAVVYFILPRMYGSEILAYRGVGIAHSLISALSWALMILALVKALKGEAKEAGA